MKDYLGALRNPRFIREFLQDSARILRRAGVAAASSYILDRLIGVHPAVLRARGRGDTAVVRARVDAFPGARMNLDWEDAGISRDLLLHGTREEAAGAFFRRALRPGHVVVDAGANIGWYVLMEAAIVGPAGRIVAIEPGPRNYELLKQNIALNGFGDRVAAVHGALAAASGTATLHLARQSNLHTLQRTAGMEGYVQFDGVVEVQALTMDELVQQHGIEPADVNVVRMDVEGFEVDVFAGMQRILSEARDLTIFVELHPKLIREARGQDEYRAFIESLRAHGFRVAAAADSLDSRLDREVALEIADLVNGHEAVELLLTRSQELRVG